ncbi:hypothetical protein DL98DRAFT_462014 [Cadophora sp. DSE1049]|nr:hypothetical protein DL98DRAFT_462014 [Cadophora sp. DSE1049]
MCPASQVSIRTRNSKPKTRTGCLTCKTRRVKCGEERPSCHRCLKFGVKCEGYRPANNDTPPRPKIRPLYPKSSQSTSPPISLVKSPFADEEEHQYFDIFCTRTSVEILPAFDIGMTRQMLLQACYTHASIRHCIIAIGALDKTSSITRDFGRLSLDSLEWTVNANRHHKIALKQYSMAIRLMTAAASNPQLDLRTTLLTSLLVLCFEAWNGNLQLAVQQIHICIKLILEWKARYGSVNNSGLSPQPTIVEGELIQIFCRLAIQVTFFSPADSTAASEARTLLGTEGRTLVSSMPESFSDLKEAELYNQGLMRQGVHFVQSNPPSLYVNVSRDEIPASIIAEQEDIQTNALRWLQIFEKLKRNVAPGREVRFARAMQLQMIVGYVCTSVTLSADEMIHDPYTDFYSQVVDLAGEVLNDVSLPDDLQATNYSFDNRVILPVWLAGVKCRDSSVREKAVELLERFPRREGIWDSICAAKMVRWVSDLENQFSEEGYIPGWARVYGLRWTTDLENRTASLACDQRVSRCSDPVGLRKMIAW